MKARLLALLVGITIVATPLLVATPARADDAADQLAAKYSPVVVIREQVDACGDGEPYLPTTVESVLGQPGVTLRGPEGEAIVAPTSQDLASKGEGWYLDLPGDPLSPGCDYETWFRTTSPDHPPTVYAHVATDPNHPGNLALQYFFFWVFNDWNDKHEGDWEMIQLLFDADTPAEALASEPISTAYAQHEGSETAEWSSGKVLLVDGHPVVYPSQGSHASYYTQAQWFGKSASAGFGCDNSLAQGLLLRPDVVLLPDEPTAGFEWVGFTGRWGQKEPSFNNGPTGPNTKMQWSQPVEWQLTKGRDAGVAMPPFGGPAADSFCTLTSAGSLLFVAVLDHPILTAGAILVLLVALFLLIRATRWRRSTPRDIDRERRAGQVVTASFAILGRRAAALWPIIVLVGVSAGAALALQQVALRRRPTDDVTDVNGLTHHALGTVVAVLAAFVLAPVIAVGLAATARVIDNLAQGRPPQPWHAIGLSVRRPAAALVQLLVYFVVTILASSLFLLPFALLFIAFWAVAMPASAVEGLGVRAALGRSRFLTKGRRWRAILLSAVLIWIGFTVPGIVGGIFLLMTGWPFWVTNLISIGFSAVLLPFSAIGLTLQFYDFRRESTRVLELTRPDDSAPGDSSSP